MSNHDVERAYVAAVLDGQADRLDRARAVMQADLDQLRDDWSSSFAAENERVAERMQKAQADHRAWLESLYDGEADEGARIDVAEAQVDASRHAPAGPAPQQPHQHAAELAEANRIRNLSMQEWAEERQRLRASTSNRGMFG